MPIKGKSLSSGKSLGCFCKQCKEKGSKKFFNKKERLLQKKILNNTFYAIED